VKTDEFRVWEAVSVVLIAANQPQSPASTLAPYTMKTLLGICLTMVTGLICRGSYLPAGITLDVVEKVVRQPDARLCCMIEIAEWSRGA